MYIYTPLSFRRSRGDALGSVAAVNVSSSSTLPQLFRDRQTNRGTERQRQRQTETDRQIDRQTDRGRDRETERDRDRHREGQR